MEFLQWPVDQEVFHAVVFVHNAADGPVETVVYTDEQVANVLFVHQIALNYSLTGEHFLVQGRVVLVIYRFYFLVCIVLYLELIHLFSARFAVEALFCDAAEPEEFFVLEVVIVSGTGRRAEQ